MSYRDMWYYHRLGTTASAANPSATALTDGILTTSIVTVIPTNSYHLWKMEFLLSAKDCQLNRRPGWLDPGQEQIMENTSSMICQGLRTQN